MSTIAIPASRNILATLILVSVQWSLIVAPLAAQEDALPFDLFGESIDNNQIYRHLEKQALDLIDGQPEDAVQQLQEQLTAAATWTDLDRTSLKYERPTKRDEVYRHMVKSSVYLGELYNCGRCDKTHAGFSGGVVISEDGLVLTNYHVMEDRKNQNKVEGYMAMTYDGKCFAIEKILAANRRADIALVQLKADGHRFHAAPIADERPDPMAPVRLISNPSGEFFVMTEGEVSRYAKARGKRGRDGSYWMEITADFGGGSSGSGVFNARGEVVGLVSQIQPLMRDPKSKGKDDSSESENRKRGSFVEMVLKKCVPLNAIHGCFEE